MKLSTPSLKHIVLGIIIAILLPIIALVAIKWAYTGRIYPGVFVGGLHLGGMNFQQTVYHLNQAARQRLTQQITLSTGPYQLNLQPQQISLDYNTQASAWAALSIGRSGDLFSNIWNLFQACCLGGITITPHMSFDQLYLDNLIDNLATQIDKPVIQTSIIEDNNELKVVGGQVGRKLDKKSTKTAIHNYFLLNSQSPTALPMEVNFPQVTEKAAQQTLNQVASLIDQPLTLTFNQKTWTLERGRLANFISLQPVSHDHYSTASPSANVGAINKFVEQLANDINQSPQDAAFVFSGNKVTTFRPSVDGYHVQTKQTIDLIAKHLFNPQLPRTLNVTVATAAPAITTESINNLGISSLLGSGVSYFADSISSRMHNIQLATSKITGTLVAPGATFSFNDTIGEITAATGYKQAYVIEYGRTVLGDGGGVCQVSTTLFRAVLNAGLPIVERYPHAYRVGYYEQSFPPGLDATVYPPSVDFKFKNDTSAYILVQATFNKTNTSLVFDLYGQPDNRTVSLSTPIISNRTPPPPPRYQEDPSLAKGITKQIERPAVGARVSFKRIVTRDQEILYDSEFVSNYQPWQAVYLVGTN